MVGDTSLYVYVIFNVCFFYFQALQYCEVIARNINMNPALYQHILVKLVYDVSIVMSQIFIPVFLCLFR